MHCAWTRDSHNLGLTRIQFHSPKVTSLTNLAKVTDQGLCYCNSNAWWWLNSNESRVISITDQLIFQEKKLRSGTLTALNTALRHSWYNVNQFTPTTIHDNVLWSVWQKLCQYREHRAVFHLTRYNKYSQIFHFFFLYWNFAYQESQVHPNIIGSN